MKRLAVLMIGGAVLLWAVVVRGDLDVLGTLTARIVDFTGASSTAPMKSGTALPGTCSVGQAFFKTDAAAGQNIYLCTAANTWTQVSGGGGGAFDWKPDDRYIALKTDFTDVGYNRPPPVYSSGFWLERQQGTLAMNAGYEANHMDRAGDATIITASTAGDKQHWVVRFHNHQGTEAQGLYYNTEKPWQLTVIFRLLSVTDVEGVVGFTVRESADPPKLVGVGVRSSVGPYLYWLTASTNQWESALSTGVSAANNAWYKVVFRSDGTTQNRMYASLNNGPEVSICPSGCDITMASTDSHLWSNYPSIFLKTLTNVQKRLILDYMSFWMDRGAAR